MKKSPEADTLYLIHISECLARIAEYSQGGKQSFFSETLTQDAIIRNLQIMPESTKRLSENFKARHPDIDWRGIAGLRNVLVHDYLKVNVDEVWEILTVDVPPFAEQIAATLNNLKTSQDEGTQI
jgi:uncharacterized protein with HEPN domain